MNGWTPDSEKPAAVTVPVSFPPKPEPETLPGRQKNTEGLERPETPVLVDAKAKPKGLMRIDSVRGAECYALVTPAQFEKFGKFEWIGVPSGHLYRMAVRKGKEQPVWLHRECAGCFRVDRWVAFLNGDQRLLARSNLRVFADKQKAKECTRNGMLNAAGK